MAVKKQAIPVVVPRHIVVPVMKHYPVYVNYVMPIRTPYYVHGHGHGHGYGRGRGSDESGSDERGGVKVLHIGGGGGGGH
ncbi:unnamed protein product [Darwinula stevensoni]|uniref:Uncharacterized protein n=1 Tax=Darwinula stevensoni TaxID=69355 RepID=A0A7R9AAM6_9CRUS|nr:unnamed protein product [Darwinula stevensoni]CAG0898293.1 unnamed protein product [Darwinula stevensoni]